MDARMIWIASLVGILSVFLIRKGWARLGLSVCLYATFIYGFVTKAAQGGFEAELVLPILAINIVAIASAGLWLLNNRAKKKSLAAPALVLAVVLALGSFILPVTGEVTGWDLFAWLPHTSGELSVHFIDVGQGDSILIQGEEVAVLIDAGPRGAKAVVAEYLHAQGISRLDLVIATHPHEDHIGGMVQVLNEFEVTEVMDPGVPHTSKTFEAFIDLISSKGIGYTEARAGMIRDLGGIKLEIVHPTVPSVDDLNNASIVTRLEFGQVAFLFTGDAEREAETEILESGRNLRATVLKLGHHGSSTSSTPEFVGAVAPSYAVIMLGEDNRYNHPHRGTMDLVKDIGIPVYRTDLHGNIVFITDGTKIEVRTARGWNGGE